MTDVNGQKLHNAIQLDFRQFQQQREAQQHQEQLHQFMPTVHFMTIQTTLYSCLTELDAMDTLCALMEVKFQELAILDCIGISRIDGVIMLLMCLVICNECLRDVSQRLDSSNLTKEKDKILLVK